MKAALLLLLLLLPKNSLQSSWHQQAAAEVTEYVVLKMALLRLVLLSHCNLQHMCCLAAACHGLFAAPLHVTRTAKMVLMAVTYGRP
jgi:hypothetical protein